MLRPVAEKLITKAKKGDLHNRREVLKTIRDKSVVHMLFTEIGPTFAERPGGYTRITKIGPRKGDNAPMAVIELVTEPYKPARQEAREELRPLRPRRRTRSRVEELTGEPVTSEDTDTNVGSEETVEAPRSPWSRSSPTSSSATTSPWRSRTVPLRPRSSPIKGNKDSGKYHTPDSQWYDQTIAEVWFTTEEAAENAGFVKAG